MVLTPLPHAATDLRDLAGQELRRFEPTEFRAQEDERTLEFSFSSELPVARWFGDEVLDHSPEAVNLSRLNDGAPVLFNHDPDRVIGVVERAWVDGEKRRGMARVRFSRNEFAQQVVADINDGILRNVSVGYAIGEAENRGESIVATEWSPHEVSVVSIPADPTVGIGRSLGAGAPALATPTPSPTSMEDNTPNIEEVRAAAMAEERARVSSITTLCREHGLEDKAPDLIERGISEAEANKLALVELAKRAKQPAQHAAATQRIQPIAGSPDIGMTEREVQSYSFVRMINAAANPADRSAQEAAAFEIEASRAAAAKRGKEVRGFMVPHDVLRRDLLAGTASAGGNMIGTDFRPESFIDLLRNQMVLDRAGITTLTGLTGPVAIPKQTASATAYWVAESGAPTESQQTIEQINMTPKTVAAFTDFSRRLMIQSSMDVEQFVRNDLARVLALELDRVGLYGLGNTNQPQGVRYVTGINTEDFGANAPTYIELVSMESKVADDNADVGSMAYLTTPLLLGGMKTTEKAANTAQFVYEPGGTVNGYPVFRSKQVISNDVWFGVWSQLMLGLFSGLDIMVDPYTGSTSGTVRVVAMQDADYAVRYAESFTRGNNSL